MMKRNILIILVIGLAGLLVLQTWGRRRAAPVEFKQISERLYEIAGGSGANGGMYMGDDAVMIIDAKQTPESVEQVIAGVKKITDKPIKYLVNTHSDGDHVAGNRFFPKDVTIISHENCRKEFFITRDGSPSPWKNPELAPYLPEVTFKNKLDIYLGTRKVELWYFGVGHTTGDLVVYFADEKVAFMGDQVFTTMAPVIHSYKGGNTQQQVKTLTKLLATLDAQRFCSGHSEMIGRADVQKQIDQMKDRQDKVKQLIAAGKNLPEVQAEFETNETRLIESIFNELKNLK
ncbi:MAG: MBL fold metallo-hydrolase [Planctomycetes bacterium]|nr:MBL fold metallo-hydrolase [Planctomycetota bacterium]